MFINYFASVESPSQEFIEDLGSDQGIVSLDTQVGKGRLDRSFHLPYSILRDHYMAQWKNYCGVASGSMVLNALGLLNVSGQPYTQESFFTASVIELKNPETVSKQGFSFEELNDCLNTFPGLHTQQIYGDEFETSADLERTFKDLMQKEDVYVIANFQRKTLGQTGGGHYSPVVAFDEESHSVLILDVNEKYAPYWVDLDRFLSSILEIKGDSRRLPRGLIVCTQNESAPTQFSF